MATFFSFPHGFCPTIVVLQNDCFSRKWLLGCMYKFRVPLFLRDIRNWRKKRPPSWILIQYYWLTWIIPIWEPATLNWIELERNLHRKFEVKLEGQSQSFHAWVEHSVCQSWHKHAWCDIQTRFGFKKKISSLSERATNYI